MPKYSGNVHFCVGKTPGGSAASLTQDLYAKIFWKRPFLGEENPGESAANLTQDLYAKIFQKFPFLGDENPPEGAPPT